MWKPKLPTVPKPLAEFFKELVAEVNRGYPIDGAGIACADGADGRVINAVGVQAVIEALATHPFKVVDATIYGPGSVTYKVRVYRGRINVMEGPFSLSDAPPYLITVSDGDVVYVDITHTHSAESGFAEVSFTIGRAASLPASSSTHAYFPLGDIVITSGRIVSPITGGVTGNIGHRRCGDASLYNDQWWKGP